jgi:N-methylhydantoinase A
MGTLAADAKLVGVDIGGTFTDVVVLDEGRRELQIGKVATTPDDQSTGFIAALDGLRVSYPAIDLVTHGTTVATNAVLERDGGRCGLIATRGFRDILELRRRDRPHMYGLTGSFEPLIPRDRRLEVTERIAAEGTVLTPLNEAEVLEAGRLLLAQWVEAIVVSFMNSYANPEHELRAKEILQAEWPHLYVVTSSETLPVFREFERTSTAVVNAYVQPNVGQYLEQLEERLSERGYGSDLFIMQSNGGMMSAASVRDLPLNTVLSGPAAGVIAATRIAAEVGLDNLITYDMGGTSLDVSLVQEGKPLPSSGMDLEFGIPLMVSMIDIHTIGAGGGSIAQIDQGGLLRVGPQSAGADPGPVCYGKSGTAPTLTDANVVLGRINPNYPIAGVAGEKFDVAGARAVITEKIGRPLGLSTEQAAQAIVTVANNRIAGSLRRVSIDKGHDPREFSLFSFGGSGPLHVGYLLRELSIGQGIVPYYPGIASAWGCVIADRQHDFVTMQNCLLSDLDLAAVEQTFADHLAAGEAMLAGENVPLERVNVVREADISYEGQTHVIRTRLPAGELNRETIAESFRSAYLQHYGRVEEGFSGLEELLAQIPIRLLNLRTAVIGVRTDVRLKDFIRAPETTLAEACKEERSVYVEDGFVDCPVYDRATLPWGAALSGPALIEQADTTVWLEPWCRANVAEGGSLMIEVT